MYWLSGLHRLARMTGCHEDAESREIPAHARRCVRNRFKQIGKGHLQCSWQHHRDIARLADAAMDERTSTDSACFTNSGGDIRSGSERLTD